jgi:hypothetical protein
VCRDATSGTFLAACDRGVAHLLDLSLVSPHFFRSLVARSRAVTKPVLSPATTLLRTTPTPLTAASTDEVNKLCRECQVKSGVLFVVGSDLNRPMSASSAARKSAATTTDQNFVSVSPHPTAGPAVRRLQALQIQSWVRCFTLCACRFVVIDQIFVVFIV